MISSFTPRSKYRQIPENFYIEIPPALKNPPLVGRQLKAPVSQSSDQSLDTAGRQHSSVLAPAVPDAQPLLSSKAPLSRDDDFARLLTLYERDKLEFEHPTKMTKPEAAKLLRDTTENLLQYIRTPQPRRAASQLTPEQVTAIERTLEQATRAAGSVYGKRKWEKGEVAAGGKREYPAALEKRTFPGRSRSPVDRDRRGPQVYSRDWREQAAAAYMGRDRYRPEAAQQNWRSR